MAGHVSVRGAARALGMTPTTIARWVRLGYLSGYRVNHRHYTDDRPRKTQRGQWRVSVDSIAALLERLYAGLPVPRGVHVYLRRKAKSQG